MKYTTKHPDGATYDLTIEEMRMPHLVQQLQISSLWKVLVEGEWMALPAFLESKGQTMCSEQGATSQENLANMLSAEAPWTPGAVFGMIVRLLGLYLVWIGFHGWMGIWLSPFSTDAPMKVLLSIVFGLISPFGLYLLVGLYILLRPHRLVSIVFSARF